MINPESIRLLTEFLAQVTEREIEIEAAREALFENDDFGIAAAFEALKHPKSEEIKPRKLENFLKNYESSCDDESLAAFFSTYSVKNSQSLSQEEFVKFLLPDKIKKDKKFDLSSFIMTNKQSYGPLPFSAAWALARTLMYELKLLGFIENYKKTVVALEDWDARATFNLITKGKEKTINVDNLSRFFKKNGLNINIPMSRRLIERYDKNNDGVLDYAEFVGIFFTYNRYSRIITRRSQSPPLENKNSSNSPYRVRYSTTTSEILHNLPEKYNTNEKARAFLIDNPSEGALTNLRGSVKGKNSRSGSITVLDGALSPSQSTALGSAIENSRTNGFERGSYINSHPKKFGRLSSILTSDSSVSHFVPTTLLDSARTSEVNYLFSPSNVTQKIDHSFLSNSKQRGSVVSNKYGAIPKSPFQQLNSNSPKQTSSFLNSPQRRRVSGRLSVPSIGYISPFGYSPHKSSVTEKPKTREGGHASGQAAENLPDEREELNKVIKEFMTTENLIEKLRKDLTLREDCTPTAIYNYLLEETNSRGLNKNSFASFLTERGFWLDNLQMELLFNRLDQDCDGEIGMKDFEKALEIREEKQRDLLSARRKSTQSISNETIELFERFLINLAYLETKTEEIRNLLASRPKIVRN